MAESVQRWVEKWKPIMDKTLPRELTAEHLARWNQIVKKIANELKGDTFKNGRTSR